MRARGAGVPPIVTILILLAFISSAAITAWFVIATTRSASRRCILGVEGVAYLGVNGRLYLSLRNDGTEQCTLANAKLIISNLEFKCSFPNSLKPGERIPVACDPPSGSQAYSAVSDGDTGVLQTPDCNVVFTVVKA